MDFTVQTSDGTTEYFRGDDVNFKVLDSGVLRVNDDDGDRRYYAPGHWVRVDQDGGAPSGRAAFVL